MPKSRQRFSRGHADIRLLVGERADEHLRGAHLPEQLRGPDDSEPNGGIRMHHEARELGGRIRYPHLADQAHRPRRQDGVHVLEEGDHRLSVLLSNTEHRTAQRFLQARHFFLLSRL